MNRSRHREFAVIYCDIGNEKKVKVMNKNHVKTLLLY